MILSICCALSISSTSQSALAAPPLPLLPLSSSHLLAISILKYRLPISTLTFVKTYRLLPLSEIIASMFLSMLKKVDRK